MIDCGRHEDVRGAIGTEELAGSVKDRDRQALGVVTRAIEHPVWLLRMLPKRERPPLRETGIIGHHADSCIGVDECQSGTTEIDQTKHSRRNVSID